jgi:hypothetical protein
MLLAILAGSQIITARFKQQMYSRGSNRAGGEAHRCLERRKWIPLPGGGDSHLLPAPSGYENTPNKPRKRHGGI